MTIAQADIPALVDGLIAKANDPARFTSPAALRDMLQRLEQAKIEEAAEAAGDPPRIHSCNFSLGKLARAATPGWENAFHILQEAGCLVRLANSWDDVLEGRLLVQITDLGSKALEELKKRPEVAQPTATDEGQAHGPQRRRRRRPREPESGGKSM